MRIRKISAKKALGLCVARLLVRVDMPDNVVGQSDDLVSCPLRHLRESFCFGLVLESITWEVDTLQIRISIDSGNRGKCDSIPDR